MEKFKPALLRVLSDLFLTTQSTAALSLLDLKSAFDVVDQNILLSWLQAHVGFKGMVLECLAEVFMLNLAQESAVVSPKARFSDRLSICLSAFVAFGLHFTKHKVPSHSFVHDLQTYLLLQVGADSDIVKLSE